MAYWDAPVEGYPPEQRDFAQVWQKGTDDRLFTNADKSSEAVVPRRGQEQMSNVDLLG